MIKEKFIKKYYRIAKLVGEDQNPCLSRSIGVIVVDPHENRIVSTGYNGPPKGTLHCDEYEYLKDVVWPQLTDEESSVAKTKSDQLLKASNPDAPEPLWNADQFGRSFERCGECPRRIVGAKSGDRLELCSCEHGEKNAVYNANESLYGFHMFCWCGVPCWDCCKAIVNKKLAKVWAIEVGPVDYSRCSRWMLENAGIELEIRKPEDVLDQWE